MQKEVVWSVELEVNSWCDDTFIGTFDECVSYCLDNNYMLNGVVARLAKIVLVDGLVEDTLDFYTA